MQKILQQRLYCLSSSRKHISYFADQKVLGRSQSHEVTEKKLETVVKCIPRISDLNVKYFHSS